MKAADLVPGGTPKWVSQSAEFRTSVASRLASLLEYKQTMRNKYLRKVSLLLSLLCHGREGSDQQNLLLNLRDLDWNGTYFFFLISTARCSRTDSFGILNDYFDKFCQIWWYLVILDHKLWTWFLACYLQLFSWKTKAILVEQWYRPECSVVSSLNKEQSLLPSECHPMQWKPTNQWCDVGQVRKCCFRLFWNACIEVWKKKKQINIMKDEKAMDSKI